jgi:hypothetical protein
MAIRSVRAMNTHLENTATLQAQAWEAFCRDLATLVQSSAGNWVAYHGQKHEYTGESPSAVYQECRRRGLTADELLVELVYPAAAEEPAIFLPTGVS